MSERDFVPPIEQVDNSDVDPLGAFDNGADPQFRLNFETEDRELILRLLSEMKDLLTSEPNERTAPLLHRLFPPAFRDDEEKEAEYQRLMREELVASRVAAVDSVSLLLMEDGRTLSKGETMAFMQSVNAIRLVLGTMLDITDDESAEEADMNDSHEYGLYGYLGWVLEWTVQALSGT
jgi:hypothetical protein